MLQRNHSVRPAHDSKPTHSLCQVCSHPAGLQRTSPKIDRRILRCRCSRAHKQALPIYLEHFHHSQERWNISSHLRWTHLEQILPAAPHSARQLRRNLLQSHRQKNCLQAGPLQSVRPTRSRRRDQPTPLLLWTRRTQIRVQAKRSRTEVLKLLPKSSNGQNPVRHEKRPLIL